MKRFSFQILEEDPTTGARLGVMTTGHGDVFTPVFMPVGTQGTVKAVLPDMVAQAGYRLILANTYHLMLRPSADVIRKHGGLHRFMNFPFAILTDSGGFQVYSLASLKELDEDGVSFRSHIDGSLCRLTPESVVEAQELFGSDIAMVLDVLPPSTAPRNEIERAVERTTRWAGRALKARKKEDMALFGIVQGGLFEDLRLEHARQIAKMGFEGIAIGGLSVGESQEEMIRVVNMLAPHLPKEKPRYLMGVGTPVEMVKAVIAGVDMFDCVFPTRAARNGLLFTWKGRMNIKNQRFKEDTNPIDLHCQCPTCKGFSRAYLRHVYQAREIIANTLLTLHNLYFFRDLVERIRCAITKSSLFALLECLEEAFAQGEEDGETGENKNI
jgi:queuine tRNA-ribosyltransferase